MPATLPVSRMLLPVLFLLLSACATLDPGIPRHWPPLPAASALPCCWQVEERIELLTQDGTMQLGGVVARSGDSLTFVLFDTLGRRLLTLVHRDGTPRVDMLEQLPLAGHSRLLLLALYLQWLPTEQWPMDSNWTLAQQAGRKTLYYRAQPRITLTEPDPARAETRTLSFVREGITLQLTTVARTVL